MAAANGGGATCSTFDPAALTCAAPNGISVQQGVQVRSNSGTNWSQYGSCEGYTPVPQERTNGLSTKITYCCNILDIGPDTDCQTGGDNGPAGTLVVMTAAQAYLSFITGGTDGSLMPQAFGLLSTCQMNVGRLIDGGPYSLTGASC